MIKKFKSIISQVLIVINSFIRGVINKNKLFEAEKIVLIPYANIFGDIVLLLDCIDEFSKIFSKEKGYQVIFICRPSVKKFLLSMYPECDLSIDEVEWFRFARDYKYYCQVLKKYSSNYEKIIVPYDHTVTNDLFVRCVCANEKITQEYDIEHSKMKLEYILSRGTYNNVIIVDKNISVLQRQKILINALGNTDFRARMPFIPYHQEGDIDTPENYAVLCPTASYLPKSWGIENFATIADYLVEEYGVNVCICGGNEEPDVFEKIVDRVKHKDKLFNYVDKTSFSQWAELLRDSIIAICNDSASYHLAASVRTPAICVAGDFACVNAPYYLPDIVSSDDRVPVVLYKKMSCEGCRYKGYRYGFGNAECSQLIKNGEKLLCVRAVTVERMIEAIKEQDKKYSIFND